MKTFNNNILGIKKKKLTVSIRAVKKKKLNIRQI